MSEDGFCPVTWLIFHSQHYVLLALLAVLHLLESRVTICLLTWTFQRQNGHLVSGLQLTLVRYTRCSESHDEWELFISSSYEKRNSCLLLNEWQVLTSWTFAWYCFVMYMMSLQYLIITVILLNVIYLYETLCWQNCTFREKGWEQ